MSLSRMHIELGGQLDQLSLRSGRVDLKRRLRAGSTLMR
jgi:hypothetical protein